MCFVLFFLTFFATNLGLNMYLLTLKVTFLDYFLFEVDVVP